MSDTISLFSNECVNLTFVIPEKAGTQETVETKWVFNRRNEFHQLKLKMAAFLWNALFILGSCFRRNDERGSRNNRSGHLIPALVSLGIHTLIASFFIPSFLKPCVQMGAPVEVVWEVSQAKPALLSYPSKVNEEKKIARLKHSPERCKEIGCTQRKTQPKQSVQKVYNPLVDQNPSPTGDASEKVSQKQLVVNQATPPSSQRQAYQPLPKYPWISRKRGHEGVVALIVKTNEDGQVIEAKLHKSSGHTPLDVCALETVKSWVFDEGAVQKTFSIAFRLKDVEGRLEESV